MLGSVVTHTCAYDWRRKLFMHNHSEAQAQERMMTHSPPNMRTVNGWSDKADF